MTFDPFFGVPPLQQQAAVGDAGFALQNATPTIISWTAPNDGHKHRWLILCTINVTSAETGGIVVASFTLAGVLSQPQLTAGGSAAQIVNANYRGGLCDPGTTVSIIQQSALSAGAATLFGEIWGI
jgi:hypothetical protein